MSSASSQDGPERVVLHALAQRPGLTGSGVTFLSLAAEMAARGIGQLAVCATPAAEPAPTVPGLGPERVRALRFGTAELPFDVPGMSDVMPYPSTVFGAMTSAQWTAYERAWRVHLAEALALAKPTVIHSHHVWFMSALLRELAPEVPLVVHCHATGLRQLVRAPEALAQRVRAGCRGADAFVVLHDDHVSELCSALDVPRDRVHVVGVGYAPERFHDRGRAPEPLSVLYVGKLAEAKGLGALLDAAELVAARAKGFRLHVVGGGSGAEAERLRTRMATLAPTVVAHGRLDDAALAELMRRCAVFALPSYYEGLPLVLVEARASGCRLVASDLVGVRALQATLGPALRVVPLPRLDVDRPHPADVPAFVERFAAALLGALAEPDLPPTPLSRTPVELAPCTWGAVWSRVERAHEAARRSHRLRGHVAGSAPRDDSPPSTP